MLAAEGIVVVWMSGIRLPEHGSIDVQNDLGNAINFIEDSDLPRFECKKDFVGIF